MIIHWYDYNIIIKLTNHNQTQKGWHNIMAGTFSQIYIQYVFAVKGRENLLKKDWRDEVFKYMAGIIKGKK